MQLSRIGLSLFNLIRAKASFPMTLTSEQHDCNERRHRRRRRRRHRRDRQQQGVGATAGSSIFDNEAQTHLRRNEDMFCPPWAR